MEEYHFIGELKRINNLIKRRVDSDEVLSSQARMTGTHGYVIGFIAHRNAEGEDVYQKDVESRFSMRRSSVTELLNNMELNGFIKRESDVKDKRLRKVVLTDKAMAVHKRVVARLQSIDEELISLLTPQEFDSLKVALGKIEDYLR
jgi:DNA-binding MarR family transcriptional regulator